MGRIDTSTLSELANGAYAAALDDAGWEAWASSMVEKLGFDGGLFWVIDAQRQSMCRNYFMFRNVPPDELAVEYLSGPVGIDPQMGYVCNAHASEIYADTDHVDLEDADTREYLAWQTDRCGTRHHLTGSAVLTTDLRAGISLHRSPAHGTASADQRRALSALFPSMSAALNLALRFNEAVSEAWWDGLVTGDMRPLLLLDETGAIIRMTPSAEALLRQTSALAVRGGRLASHLSDGCERIVQAALRPLDPVAGSVELPRAGRLPLRLFAYPLVRSRRYLAPHEAAVLIHVFDPAIRPASVDATLAGSFGLSPREREIAGLLLGGHSVESLAEVLEISPHTAKVHLRSIFGKTDTNRQSDLVRLLMAAQFGPVANSDG